MVKLQPDSSGSDVYAHTSSFDVESHWSQDDTEDTDDLIHDVFKDLSWRPCSKQDLLRILRGQIQHINDLAALMFGWTAYRYHNWEMMLAHLGLSVKDVGMTCQGYNQIAKEPRSLGLGALEGSCNAASCRMKDVEAAIQQAFLLGWDGFLDFYGKQDDAANKWQDFIAFDTIHEYGCVQYDLEFHDQLAFMCVLCRQQQLPAQAVLARLHGMLSRCCRFDLLLLSRVLKHERYREGNREEPRSNILSAFGQHCSAIKPVMSALSHQQRCSMISCVKVMVDSLVAHSK